MKTKYFSLFITIFILFILISGCDIMDTKEESRDLSVSLTSPTNNTNILADSVSFVWTGNTITYVLFLKRDGETGLSPILNSTTEKSHTQAISKSGKYYWQVIGQWGSKDIASKIFSFTLEKAIKLSLVSPTNGAADIKSNTSLTWSSNADTFIVYLGETETGLTAIDTIQDTTFQPSGLSYGLKTYYWKIVANTIGGQKKESSIYNFVTSNSITLDGTSPTTDTIALLTNSNTFSWSSSADSFIFYWDGVPLQSSSDTFYTQSGFDFEKNYVWKVVAIHKSSNQTKAIEKNFFAIKKIDTTIIDIPYNGSTVSSLTPSVKWRSNNASSYRVFWGSNIDSLNDSTSLTTDTFTVIPSGISYGNNTYYYKVKSYKTGNQTSSSIIDSFVSDNEISINLITKDTIAQSGDSLTIYWESFADSYFVYVDSVNPPTKLIGSTNSKSFLFTPVNFDSLYYCKVVAKDTAKNILVEDIDSFVVVEKIEPITLITPTNNAQGLGSPVVMKWNKTNASSYTVFWSLSQNSFTDSFVNGADTSFSKNFSYNGNTYYWKVVAHKTGNQSVESQIYKFKMDMGLYLNLSSPQSDTIVLSTNSIKFSWNSTADSFYFYLDDTLRSSLILDTLTFSGFSFETPHKWKVIAKDTSSDRTIVDSITFLPTETISTTSLLSPSTGTAGLDTIVILDWSNSNANNYTLQWGTSESVSNSITISDTQSIDTLSNLSFGATKYYWRVISHKLGNQKDTSVIYNFITDSTLTASLVYPASDTIILVTNDTTISFNSNADSIYLYLALSSPPTTLVASLQKGSFSYNATSLNFDTTYYIKAIVKDTSSGQQLTLNDTFVPIEKLKATTLVSPSNGATGLNSPVYLIWNKSNATNYTAYYGSTSNNITTPFSSGQMLNDTTAVFTQPSGGTYYWKVYASKPGYGSLQSNFSESRSFATNGVIFLSLNSPKDTVVLATNSVTFSWIKNRDSSEIYVGLTNPPTYSTTTASNSFIFSGFSWDTTYYWRVKLKGNDPSDTTSATESFFPVQTLDTTKLLYPNSGKTGLSTSFVAYWTNSNANSYTIYWGDENPPTDSSNIITGNSGTDTFYTISGLTYGKKTYYWKVVANKLGNQKDTSAIYSFVTDTNITLSLNKVVGVDTVVNDSSKTTLSFVTNADSFKIFIDTSGSFSSPIKDTTITDTFYIATLPVDEKTYFWKVNVTDTSSAQVASLTDTFFYSKKISATTSLAPNGTTKNPTSVNVSWSNTNANNYTLSWGKDSTSWDSTKAVATTSYNISGLSLGDSTYFWQVIAHKLGGQKDTSTIAKFTTDTILTISDVTPAPDISPDTVVVDTILDTLFWSSNGTTYSFAIDNNKDFSSTIYTSSPSDTQQIVNATSGTGLTWDTRYYWKAKALRTSSNQVDSIVDSIVFVEKIDSTVLNTPTKDSTLLDTAFTFHWNSGNAASHKLYYGTDSTNLSTLLGSTTSDSMQINSLSFNTKYFWRVISYKNGAQIDTSGIWSFTTEPEVLLKKYGSDSIVAEPQSGRFKTGDYVVYDWRVGGVSLAKLNIPMKSSANSGGKDYSSYGNNATLTNVSWTAFTGSDSKGSIYLSGDGTSHIYINPISLTGKFTIMASLKADTITISTGLFFDFTNNRSFTFLNTNEQRFYADSNTKLSSDSLVADSVWTRHTLARNGSDTLTMFQDTTKDNDTTWSGEFKIAYIGSSYQANFAKTVGYMENVLIFDILLSDEQIKLFGKNIYHKILGSDFSSSSGNWSVSATLVNSGTEVQTITTNSVTVP